MDTFNETLRSWQNFYFMAGGAAAALLSLMFVALSLGMHLISENTLPQMKVFVTPNIFYFVSALALACAMLIPTHSPPILAAILLIGGGGGLARTIHFVKPLFRAAQIHQDFTLADWLCGIILPVGGYALLLVAGVCFAIDQWPVGFTCLWLFTVFLLVATIGNIWSLIVWIVSQQLK